MKFGKDEIKKIVTKEDGILECWTDRSRLCSSLCISFDTKENYVICRALPENSQKIALIEGKD